MPQVVIDNTKGLHQKTGSGFVSSTTDHGALANAAVDLSVGEMINFYQANGGGGTAITVLTTGASTGQIAIFANNSGNTSTVNGKTVAGGTAALIFYDGTAWVELA